MCGNYVAPYLGVSLIGIHEYFRRLSGDRLVNQMRDTLTNKLIDLYEHSASDDWPWFEDVASYDNAKLSHALILSGRWGGNERALQIGLRSLRWLADKQLSSLGRFRPIGCNGFCRRGQPVAEYDQQPIEAHAMVSAAIEAFNAVDDLSWSEQAHLAFDWFLGRNDLGQPLYDTGTGGCHDGLQENRLNENQGAESTLAFLAFFGRDGDCWRVRSPRFSRRSLLRLNAHQKNLETASVIHAT